MQSPLTGIPFPFVFIIFIIYSENDVLIITQGENMDTITKTQTARTKHNGSSVKAHLRSSKSSIKEATDELLNEGKRFADKLYREGAHRINDAEGNVKEYSDQLLKKAKQNPLATILISAGVGFILSSLLRK